MRTASAWQAGSGDSETSVSHLYARAEEVADLAEELPGDRNCHGIDGPVLAVGVECAGGSFCEADPGESAAHQGPTRAQQR